jgi:hypothetical protein
MARSAKTVALEAQDGVAVAARGKVQPVDPDHTGATGRTPA